MDIVLMVLSIVFGLAVGSFLNVLIYRIPRGESIVWPGSHCTTCGHELKVLDLIPVFSYIFLGAKCRYCKDSIALRYPMVESVTAIVFLSLFMRFEFSIEFFASLVFMVIMIAVFFIDMDEKIIPNILVLVALGIGVILVVIKLIFNITLFDNVVWWENLLGLLPGTVILFIIAQLGKVIYKVEDAMGMGDVKIFAAIGLFLGWKLCIVALALSIFFGGITSIALLISKIKDRKDEIPFGPFIVLATYVTMLFGDILLDWYMKLI